MSRYRLRSRSHVIVRVDVLAMLPSSVVLVQFIDDMVSLFTRFSQSIDSGCRRSPNSSLGFTIVENSELPRTQKGVEDE